MKVIDIYNKIANGEEPPNKIRTLGYTFIYTGDKRPQRFYKLENQDNYLLRDFVYTLNTEVKIIEEEKIPETIKTKIGYGGLTYLEDEDFSNGANGFNHREDVIVSKINEIIVYLQSKGE